MSDYADLIARLEKATGPENGLGQAVLKALGGKVVFGPEIDDFVAESWWEIGGSRWRAGDPAASLDAAVALCELVLPGWFWRITKNAGTGLYDVILHGPANVRQYVDVDGLASPAIALCLAILRAKAAEVTPSEA